MSKIVIGTTKLVAPSTFKDLALKLDPAMAEFLEEMDQISFIRNLVKEALNILNDYHQAFVGGELEDYYGNRYESDKEIIGVLKNEKLPHGMGITIDSMGKIEFLADDYEVEWKNEFKKLQDEFSNAFTTKAQESILNLLGYDIDLSITKSSEGRLLYNIDARKDEEEDWEENWEDSNEEENWEEE